MWSDFLLLHCDLATTAVCWDNGGSVACKCCENEGIEPAWPHAGIFEQQVDFLVCRFRFCAYVDARDCLSSVTCAFGRHMRSCRWGHGIGTWRSVVGHAHRVALKVAIDLCFQVFHMFCIVAIDPQIDMVGCRSLGFASNEFPSVVGCRSIGLFVLDRILVWCAWYPVTHLFRCLDSPSEYSLTGLLVHIAVLTIEYTCAHLHLATAHVRLTVRTSCACVRAVKLWYAQIFCDLKRPRIYSSYAACLAFGLWVVQPSHSGK